jgi:transposase-like protein
VVPKGNADMVAAAIRTIFAQPDAASVHEQFDDIATKLERMLPKVAAMMREAKDDLLAFTAFPQAHWRQLWSTNPLERTNKEIKRRTDVVGVFPNPAALLRLAGAVLIEQHDEWAASDRRYFSERSMALLTTPDPDIEGQVNTPELMTA